VYPAEARQAGSTAVDRSVLPPLGDPPEVAFPAVQRTQLSNGATVLLVERHTAPLVNVSGSGRRLRATCGETGWHR
jgi:zinc protease